MYIMYSAHSKISINNFNIVAQSAFSFGKTQALVPFELICDSICEAVL